MLNRKNNVCIDVLI